MSASILSLLVSLEILFSALGGSRIYHPAPAELSDAAITLAPDTLPASTMRVEARVAMQGIGERSGMAPAWWEMALPSGSDTLTVSLRHGNSDYGDLLDRRFTRLTVSLCGSILWEGDTDGFSTHSGGFNSMRLEADRASGMLRLFGGSDHLNLVKELPLPKGFVPIEALTRTHGKGVVSMFCCEKYPDPESLLTLPWNMEELLAYLDASTDPVEGVWEYFDRENNPTYARPGGRYTLATVSDGQGGYLIVYLGGAEIYTSRWKPMMVKGRLTPTAFLGHYDLRWVDAEFLPIERDIHAVIDTDNSRLSLNFPLLKTVINFAKRPEQ